MRPHKNAKDGSGLPYVRTKKSVLVQIENEAKASKPMHVFDKVHEDCGWCRKLCVRTTKQEADF